MSEIIPVGSLSNPSISQTGQSGAGGFEGFLNGATSTISQVVSNGASVFGGGLQMTTDLFGLIEMQRQLQVEMETVSMISNIDKSRHESKMAAIRNIRTS